MEFVEQVMGGSRGIQWFYIAGLLIFIFLFIIILYRTYRIPKSEINMMKEDILDDEDKLNNPGLNKK